MDLKNGYNVDLAADRKKAWDSIIRDEQTLVIGSPPCTHFSRLQESNKHMYKDDVAWTSTNEDNLEQAKRYVRFCIKIYDHQRAKGRYFLHEHPWLATSWFMPEMDRLAEEIGVYRERTDMCQFGMLSRTAGIGSAMGHVLKPTAFLTNSKHIFRELARRCPRDHDIDI